MVTGENKPSLLSDHPLQAEVAPRQYHLSLYCCESSAQVCILNKESGKIIAFDDLGANWLNDLATQPWSGWTFASADATFEAPQFTLLPAGIHDEAQNEAYLKLLFGALPADYSIAQDKFEHGDLVSVYAIPNASRDAVVKQFPYARLQHARTTSLQTLLRLEDGKSAARAYLNFVADQMQVTLFRDGELIFHNQFPTETKEDVGYYAMQTLNQHGFDPSSTVVVASGSINQRSDRWKLLKTYLPRLSAAERSASFGRASFLHTFETQHHFILFNQHLCE